MSPKSAEVDAYIAASPAFARPILEKIRKAAHKACPEMEEAIKWRAPHFVYKGMVASMAAFKAHVGMGFWRSKTMKDPERLFVDDGGDHKHLARLESVDDLPSEKILLAYFKEAVDLNLGGAPQPRAAKRKSSEGTKPPKDFADALKANRKANDVFEGFSPTKRREYIEWIVDAKKEETRASRILTAIEWIADGKSRNWKYEKC